MGLADEMTTSFLGEAVVFAPSVFCGGQDRVVYASLLGSPSTNVPVCLVKFAFVSLKILKGVASFLGLAP